MIFPTAPEPLETLLLGTLPRPEPSLSRDSIISSCWEKGHCCWQILSVSFSCSAQPPPLFKLFRATRPLSSVPTSLLPWLAFRGFPSARSLRGQFQRQVLQKASGVLTRDPTLAAIAFEAEDEEPAPRRPSAAGTAANVANAAAPVVSKAPSSLGALGGGGERGVRNRCESLSIIAFFIFFLGGGEIRNIEDIGLFRRYGHVENFKQVDATRCLSECYKKVQSGFEQRFQQVPTRVVGARCFVSHFYDSMMPGNLPLQIIYHLDRLSITEMGNSHNPEGFNEPPAPCPPHALWIRRVEGLGIREDDPHIPWAQQEPPLPRLQARGARVDPPSPSLAVRVLRPRRRGGSSMSPSGRRQHGTP